MLIAESGILSSHHKFVRTPVLLIVECGAIDSGIRSPVLLNAVSGPGGAPRGLGVTLSATICLMHISNLVQIEFSGKLTRVDSP